MTAFALVAQPVFKPVMCTAAACWTDNANLFPLSLKMGDTGRPVGKLPGKLNDIHLACFLLSIYTANIMKIK
jgi:hypothetical protein